MKTKKLLLIGAVAVGGYLLYTRVIAPKLAAAKTTT